METAILNTPKLKQALIYFFRLLFLSLISFEFLNLIKILNFPLDFSWFGLIITASVVWAAVEILSRLLKNQQRLGTILGLSFLVVFLDALGDVCHFYSHFELYDRFLHFAGGGVIVYLVYILTKDFFESIRLHLASAVSLSNLFCVLYEIEEYLEDVFIHHRPLRLGDGPDTADDLLMNLLGALFVAFIIFFAKKIKDHRHI